MVVEIFTIKDCRLDILTPDEIYQVVNDNVSKTMLQGAIMLPGIIYRLDLMEHPNELKFKSVHSLHLSKVNNALSYLTGPSVADSIARVVREEEVLPMMGYRNERGSEADYLAYLVKVRQVMRLPIQAPMIRKPQGKILTFSRKI